MYTDEIKTLKLFGVKPESQNHPFICGFFFPEINQESQL